MEQAVYNRAKYFAHLKYPLNYTPKIHREMLDSGSGLLRFSNLYDIYYYDNPANTGNLRSSGHQYISGISSSYFTDRNFLSEDKKRIIKKVEKELNKDKDFLDLIHQGKTAKRKIDLNKFSGSLSMVDYIKQSEKIFKKRVDGKKSKTLNIAFQVGTFVRESYEQSFMSILKLILSCQALNISLNIDVFDSDNRAWAGSHGYTIVNVADASKKINYVNLFAFYHEEFFRYTLFNSYLALNEHSSIGTFLTERQIINDLGDRYDIIGGNMVNKELSSDGTISRILKIAKI